MSFNKLSDAEQERLSILLEECGEVIQVIGKIQRHGYHTSYAGVDYNNRADLAREVGDLLSAIDLLANPQDISFADAFEQRQKKTKERLTHHQNSDT